MIYFILIVMAILGMYFAFRYISLLYAFRKMKQEMCDIQKDLTQNQTCFICRCQIGIWQKLCARLIQL